MGIYEPYKKSIEEIIRTKNLIALKEPCTWYQFSKQERQAFMQYIYQYLKKQSDIDYFDTWLPIARKMDENPLYRAKILFLKKQLQAIKQQQKECRDSLTEAKKILSKYQN